MNNKPHNQKTMKKLVSLEKRITQMLTSNSSLRNDNRKLCLAIWKKEAKEKKIESPFFVDFVENYKRGSLTSADNITRIARLVKEHNPELRGTNYADNKKKAQLIKPLLKK